MEGINKCSNGHFYREDLESCPFCSSDKTENMKDSNEVMPNENLKTDIVLKLKSFTTKILDKIKNTSFEEGSFFLFLKNKTFYFHFTIASVICLLFFYFLLLFLNTYTLNSEEFELKDYQGLSVDEIKSEFENNDLVFEIMDSIYTDSVPKGTVYSQQPSSGTFVKEGRKIYLTINCNSSQKFSIPDVYNKSEREAKIQLKSHFKVESVYSLEYSDIYSVVTNMKVANKEVVPGQMLIEGTTISLYFGSGRGTSKIVVPNLVGYSKDQALFVLEENKLRLGEIISEGEIIDTSSAIVINQRPLWESRLQSGDMVDIIIKQSVDSTDISDTTTIQ